MEIPNGRPPLFPLLFVCAVGLLMWKFIHLFVWRLKIDGTKGDLNVVTHHVLGIRRKQRIMSSARAVVGRVRRVGNRYFPGMIFAAIGTDQGEMPILFELFTRKGLRQQQEILTALAHFLGIPAVNENPR